MGRCRRCRRCRQAQDRPAWLFARLHVGSRRWRRRRSRGAARCAISPVGTCAAAGGDPALHARAALQVRTVPVQTQGISLAELQVSQASPLNTARAHVGACSPHSPSGNRLLISRLCLRTP